MNKQIIIILNFLLSVIIFIWVVGIFWNFIVWIFPSTIKLLPFINYNYSIVCHVKEEKLFSFWNFKTLLCSRCTGIYIGGLFSSLAILFGQRMKISTKFLLISSLPIFLDIIAYSFGLYNYSQYIALATGLLLGSLGFIYIHNSILELLINKKR